MRRIRSIEILLTSAFLISILSTASHSQTRARLKAPTALLDVLDKVDRDCVMQSGLDKSVTVTPLRLASSRSPQLLVKGSGLCLCGAQNCAFWIYQKTGSKYELLLKGTGSNRVRAARASAKGYRDIISESHASANETIIRTYRYDGAAYQLQTCINRAYYDDKGNYTKKPIDRPCGDSTPDETSISVPNSILNQELTTIDNQQLRLSDYSHRIIVINLFASWCVPCRKNIPDLNVISRNLKKDVQIIGVVAHENDRHLENLRRFAQILNVPFPVIWEDSGFTDSLSSLVPGLHVLPQTFIIDKESRLRKHFRGFNSAVTPALVREALDEVRPKQGLRTH